ncbi:hypothetical protein AAFN88_10235 [Pelagibius sp. CAU 1746]|uniref:hypothetical protein n=1 Tax=Pelagibius sp. CAU 1746 TaxID=3140370 RepID=UPI00325A4F5E
MMPNRTLSPLSPVPAALLAGLAAVLALSGPARADSYSSEVTHLASPRLEVESNGSSYHSTNPLAKLAADVHLEIDTGFAGGVKSWTAFLGLAREDGVRMWFQSFGKSKSYPWYDRPNSVNRTERLELPEYAWGAFVRTQCNELAGRLRAQGLPNSAIFGQDRKLVLGVVSSLDVNNSGPGSNGVFVAAVPWDSQKKVEVVCKKWPGAAIPQASTTLAAPPSKVVNKGLSIYEQYGVTGVCKIRLDGWITTDQKNATVKFRYKNQQGKQSQVWTVNTGESRTATFSHWYDIQNTEWAETGFVRMVGVSHNFRSEWAEYTMDCTEGGPQSLATDRLVYATLKVVPQGKVMVHGRICPETVKLIAVLEGRGNASGEMMFFGTAFFSQRYDFSITPGQKVFQGADAPLHWNSVPAPGHANLPLTLSRQFGLKLTDRHGRVIASVPQQPFVFGCSAPAVNPAVQPAPGGLTVEPRQPGAGAAAPRQLRVLPQAPQPQPVPPRRLQPRAPE